VKASRDVGEGNVEHIVPTVRQGASLHLGLESCVNVPAAHSGDEFTRAGENWKGKRPSCRIGGWISIESCQKERIIHLLGQAPTGWLASPDDGA
jgi:hypothetical protein